MTNSMMHIVSKRRYMIGRQCVEHARATPIGAEEDDETFEPDDERLLDLGSTRPPPSHTKKWLSCHVETQIYDDLVVDRLKQEIHN